MQGQGTLSQYRGHLSPIERRGGCSLIKEMCTQTSRDSSALFCLTAPRVCVVTRLRMANHIEICAKTGY